MTSLRKVLPFSLSLVFFFPASKLRVGLFALSEICLGCRRVAEGRLWGENARGLQTRAKRVCARAGGVAVNGAVLKR